MLQENNFFIIFINELHTLKRIMHQSLKLVNLWYVLEWTISMGLAVS